MTVRCPECSATLRVKAERVGNRSHGTCPSCRASVPLKPADDRIQVRCDQCGTMLKAPAASAGMQGRCPKCRAAIAIGAPMSQMSQTHQTSRAHHNPPPPAAQAHPQPHAHQESPRPQAPPARQAAAARQAPPVSQALDARPPASGHNSESSVSTQRISVKALGVETMAISGSAGEATPADTSTTRQTPGQSGTSLLDAPSPALAAAAERIKAAARGIGPASTPPETEKKSETKAAPRTLAQILEQRERAHDEQFASVAKVKAFSAFQGLLSGVTAGAIVGTIWAVLSSRLDAAIIQAFLAPTPALAARLNISRDILAITLPVVLGGLVGLLTAWTEPARSAARPGLRFVRSAGFGLVIGLAMAALWFMDSGNPVNLAGITPALNWVRDMMVTGIFTGLLVLLFARSRA